MINSQIKLIAAFILLPALILAVPGCAKADHPRGKLIFFGKRSVDQKEQTYIVDNGEIKPFYEHAFCAFANQSDLVACEDAVNKKIRIFNLEGAEVKSLDIDKRANQIRWSYDDKYLVYIDRISRPGPGIRNQDIVQRINVASAEITNIYEGANGEGIGALMLSPTKYEIIFRVRTDNGNKIYLVDVSNEDAVVKPLMTSGGVGSIWYPDGDHIGMLVSWNKYNKDVDKSSEVLAKINIRTGEKQIVKKIIPEDMLNYDPISITRDGKYYMVVERKQKNMMGGGTRIVFWDVNDPEKKYPMTDFVYIKELKKWSTASVPDWLPTN